jgi:hypothetical protein
MTKEEFKSRWESNDNGGGISFNDLSECAKEWGIASRPRIMPIDTIRYLVLKAANTVDAEDYKPEGIKY